MVISKPGDAAAPGGAGQEAQLHEIGLVHILQRYGFFADGSSQRLQTHRAAAVVADNGGEHPAVDGVKSQSVYFQP